MSTREIVKLLIVDDEQELREILSEQLEELTLDVAGVTYGVQLETANNGRQAFELFHANSFDALLTDINMPEMNGLELLAALRGEGRHVPSVVLTGFGDKNKAAEALRLGCIAFLDKPWSAANLRKVVLGALVRGVGMRELNREVEERVVGYSALPETRKRQLRSVFRSILIDDGTHRSDVCAVPDAAAPGAPVKKSAS